MVEINAFAHDIIERNLNLTSHWGYEYGLLLEALIAVDLYYGNHECIDYAFKVMDHFVLEQGEIKGYTLDEYNIDHLNNGKVLITLYDLSKSERYKSAAATLFKQSLTHPRTKDGVFFHKKIYPHQIWCDGLYMGLAFIARFARAWPQHEYVKGYVKNINEGKATTNHHELFAIFLGSATQDKLKSAPISTTTYDVTAPIKLSFNSHGLKLIALTASDHELFSRVLDDICAQFILSYQHLLADDTGLLYHAYDDSKSMYWCDKESGCSAHAWGRALGWYMMALVDIMELVNKESVHYKVLNTIFNKLSVALLKVADKRTSLWYQVLDESTREHNYLEASASAMLCYAFIKAYRLHFLSTELKTKLTSSFLHELLQSYEREFVSVDAQGLLSLNRICAVAGLGGVEKRDGSFEYYIKEKVVSNEPKGLGPYLRAAIELKLM